MAKLNIYSLTGTKTSGIMPKVFQEKGNPDLLAQAVRVYGDRSHPGFSKVKTRGEINLTTAKVWRQKGTGRARHGARSAPIFVGGGVAHGPKGIKRTLKMSQKMAKKSLFVALSLKAKKGEIVAVSNLSKIEKTREAQKVIDVLIVKESLKKDSNLSIVIRNENGSVKRAFRNLRNVRILNFESLNTLEVLSDGLLVFEKEGIDIFGGSKTLTADKNKKVLPEKTSKVAEPKKKIIKAKDKKGTK